MNSRQHDVRITVLADNTASSPDLLAEHGLSLWIETRDFKLLFDTGQGQALPRNAAKLNIPLEQAAAVALSHGHYDHTGGLACFLDRNKTARLFLHPDALHPRFSRHADRHMHAIGMPSPIVDVLRTIPGRITWTTQLRALTDRIWVTGPIPRETSFEDTGGEFFLDSTGLAPDPITDDQALWMETSKGLVVILGCAHSGVVNTLRHISKLTGARTFHAVIGGLHLGKAGLERLTATAAAFSRYEVSMLGLAHCTGGFAGTFLLNHLSGRVHSCSAGEELAI